MAEELKTVKLNFPKEEIAAAAGSLPVEIEQKDGHVSVIGYPIFLCHVLCKLYDLSDYTTAKAKLDDLTKTS